MHYFNHTRVTAGITWSSVILLLFRLPMLNLYHNEEAYSGCKNLGRAICDIYYSNTAHTVKLQLTQLRVSLLGLFSLYCTFGFQKKLPLKGTQQIPIHQYWPHARSEVLSSMISQMACKPWIKILLTLTGFDRRSCNLFVLSTRRPDSLSCINKWTNLIFILLNSTFCLCDISSIWLGTGNKYCQNAIIYTLYSSSFGKYMYP